MYFQVVIFTISASVYDNLLLEWSKCKVRSLVLSILGSLKVADMAGKSRELGNLVPGKFSHLEGNLWVWNKEIHKKCWEILQFRWEILSCSWEISHFFQPWLLTCCKDNQLKAGVGNLKIELFEMQLSYIVTSFLSLEWSGGFVFCFCLFACFFFKFLNPKMQCPNLFTTHNIHTISELSKYTREKQWTSIAQNNASLIICL